VAVDTLQPVTFTQRPLGFAVQSACVAHSFADGKRTTAAVEPDDEVIPGAVEASPVSTGSAIDGAGEQAAATAR
jgi:hypothetical protein